MADLYKVVLKGKAILGWARADVVANLAALMKVDPEKASDYLQGEPLTVKQNVDKLQAEKIQEKIREAGAECDIVKLDVPAAAKKAPRRPANAMECPKCGHVQQKGLDECGGCGVLFAKMAAIAEAERQAKAAAEAPKPHFLEDLAYFIGPNKDYYFKQVERFRQRQGAFVWTWNWSAFLASFWWLLYRKMPLAAGIVFVGVCIPGVQLLVCIVLGGVANFLYFQQAKKQIAQVRTDHPTGDIGERLVSIGGVNERIKIMGPVVSVLIVALAVALPFYARYQMARQLAGLSTSAILKPTFQTAEGFKEAGTACVIVVPEYERFMMLTAHHLFGPPGGFEKAYAWNEIRALVQQVNATTPADLALVVSTREVLQIPNAAVFNGRRVNRDLAVFPLPDKPPVPVFELAPELPAPGDRVWLMAFSGAAGAAGDALHRARVLEAGATGIAVQFENNELSLSGSSGAAVLDVSGALAGILVAGVYQDGQLYGYVNPATEIRMLIEEGFKL
jgi:hypothetical protein